MKPIAEPSDGPALRFDNIHRIKAPEPKFTKGQIEARLREAIRILAVLPDRERRWIYGSMTAWPETLREAIDVMAIAFYRLNEEKRVSAYDDMKPGRAVPSAAAIDRMDETLPWLSLLDNRARNIVTAKAFDVSWVKLAAKYGRTERTIQRWYVSAIDLVWLAVAVY